MLTALRLHPRTFLAHGHNLIERALADPARTVLDLPFVVALTPQHPDFVYQRVPDPPWV